MGRKSRRGSGNKAQPPAADPAQRQRLLPPASAPPKVPPQPQPPAFYNEFYGPPLGPPVDANGIVVGQWAAGLCACWGGGLPNCLMPALLPCVSLAQIASRLGVARFGNAAGFFLTLWLLAVACGVAADVIAAGDVSVLNSDGQDDDDGGGDQDWLLRGTLSGAGLRSGGVALVYALQLVQCAAGVALFLSTWQLRANVRERFRIPGSCAGDCCSVCWLSSCVIAQMAAHIRSFRPGACDLGPVDTLPAYDYGKGARAAAEDAKEPSGAYQRYAETQDGEKQEDEDDGDEEMKGKMRAVDTPSMRYM